MENTILMLGNVEIITNGDVVRKQCTFEERAASRFNKDVYRRVIGSTPVIVNFFPKRYNDAGDLEVDNADYNEIDSFLNDEVPGLEVHTVYTTPFNFPSDDADANPRTSVKVVTMAGRSLTRTALYQLRGTGASFTDELGVEHTATTHGEQELRVKEGRARSAKLKGAEDKGSVNTPKSEDLSPLEQAEAALEIAEAKLAKAKTDKQKATANAEILAATELIDSLTD